MGGFGRARGAGEGNGLAVVASPPPRGCTVGGRLRAGLLHKRGREGCVPSPSLSLGGAKGRRAPKLGLDLRWATAPPPSRPASFGGGAKLRRPGRGYRATSRGGDAGLWGALPRSGRSAARQETFGARAELQVPGNPPGAARRARLKTCGPEGATKRRLPARGLRGNRSFSCPHPPRACRANGKRPRPRPRIPARPSASKGASAPSVQAPKERPIRPARRDPTGQPTVPARRGPTGQPAVSWPPVRAHSATPGLGPGCACGTGSQRQPRLYAQPFHLGRDCFHPHVQRRSGNMLLWYRGWDRVALPFG